MITLILGGARSGKSSFAQKLAESRKVLFVATAEALDDEMRERIEEHKKQRPSSWRTLEATSRIGKKIAENVGNAEVVIIDCITMLVSNVMHEIERELDELIDCMKKVDASFIIISNEVGLGIVPENKLSRTYRDALGWVNKRLAEYADEVFFMIAGIPVKIK
jgi:adenosylcobinamide kinase/adenosylcobinamide-phosphate guanylyltransferase